MNLILLTGMPGARKSDISRLMASYGHMSFNMSDIITRQLDLLSINKTPDNYHKCANEMRSNRGPEVLARLTAECLGESVASLKIVDGIRTMDELSFFRAHCTFCCLVLVHASRRSRHNRMRSRSGPELQSDLQLEMLDRQNLDLGIAQVMAEADYIISTEGYLGHDLTTATSLIYRAILEEFTTTKNESSHFHSTLKP
jgi:dephospho-CoA kinase